MMTRKDNVLAIMSPKGGVGKTVTAVNVAVALAEKLGKKILLIDTNVSTASLGLHLDIFYPKATVNDISKSEEYDGLVHHYSENLDVVPASIKVKGGTRDPKIMIREMYGIVKKYNSLIDKFHKKYDMIIMDCAPGLDMESIPTMHVAGGLIIVVNPEYPSVVSAAKCIEYAKHSGMPVGGMILTKVRNKSHELKKDAIEEALKVKIIQEIPYDKKISESINRRKPIVLLKPFSKSARAYKKLASRLVESNKKESFFSKIKRMIIG